jgi:hypothetical protein
VKEGKCCECGMEIAGRWERAGAGRNVTTGERLRRYVHLNL